MNIHVFQHVAFEGLGAIQNWIDLNHFPVTYTRFFESDIQIPDFNHIDFLIVLGGPMSVNDESELPWLIQEKQWIKQAIAENKKILGICLGAQLIANVLGAEIQVMPQKEIGWFPVSRNSNQSYFLQDINALTVLHWHGEQFGIPAGASALLASAACAHQSFEINQQILGLQFHLEFNQHSIDSILSNCAHELTETPSKFIQTPEHIKRDYSEHAQPCHQALFKVLNRFMRLEL